MVENAMDAHGSEDAAVLSIADIDDEVDDGVSRRRQAFGPSSAKSTPTPASDIEQPKPT